MKRGGEERVPDLSLERYRLGELPAAAAAELTERIGRDPKVADRLERLAASDAEILAARPPAETAAAIRRRLAAERGVADRGGTERRRLRPVRLSAFVLPAAAGVLLTLAFVLVRERFLDGGSGARAAEPATALSVWRTTGGGAERLADGAVARAGDVVRFSYRAAGARYGVILSIDGRGVVTFHLPAGWEGARARSPALDGTGEITLAAAYELDVVPSFERFFLVYGDEPFEVSAAADPARLLAAGPATALRGRLDLPSGLRQVSFLLVQDR